MSKEKGLKDQFSEQLRKEGEHSNWFETADAKKLIKKIEAEFEGVKIGLDEEYVTVNCPDGRVLQIHRWKEIPNAPDGQHVVAHEKIENVIRNFINK